MSFGWAGASAGASDELQNLLTQRRAAYLQQQQMQQQQRASGRADQELALQQSEAAATQAERAANRQQTASNTAGLDKMIADPASGLSPQAKTLIQLNRYGAKGINSVEDITGKPTPPVKRTVITTLGPKGGPLDKAFTDEELAAGVDKYEPPKAPSDKPNLWVNRGGKAVYVDPSQVQPGDTPYDKPAADPKLPQREDDTVTSIHQMMPMIDELLNSTQSRIKAKGGPAQGVMQQIPEKLGRVAQGLAYRSGLAQSPDIDQRQQLGGLLQILGTVPYLRGIRNMQYVTQVQQHLADPSATDESIAERLTNLKKILPGMEQAIYDVHNKGVIPHAHTGAMAGPNTGGQITVTAPDGSVHPFASQAEADTFKQLAGIK